MIETIADNLITDNFKMHEVMLDVSVILFLGHLADLGVWFVSFPVEHKSQSFC